MDNTTQLFIRACKRPGSMPRLHRIYKRFYFGGNSTEAEIYQALASIMSTILDKYCPMTSSKMIDELRPGWQKAEDHNERAVIMIRNRIAVTKVGAFPGLTKPLWYRISHPENKNET